MTEILLATRNRKKLVELERILAASLPQATVVGIDDVPDFEEVAETEATFEGNALLKARAGALATGLLTIADDSGLCVDALNGMPGVLSARWAGGHGDDIANLELVLAQVEQVPDDRRGAAFVCAAVAAWPDGRSMAVEGRVEGRLIRSPRGSNGFGYDPVFVPHGLDQTTAELDELEKDAISHRGQALRALAARLADAMQLP